MVLTKTRRFATSTLISGLLILGACAPQRELKIVQTPLPPLPKTLTEPCGYADESKVKAGEIATLKEYTYVTEGELGHCKSKHNAVVEIYNCFRDSKTTEALVSCATKTTDLVKKVESAKQK
jgi:hypothetical protein